MKDLRHRRTLLCQLLLASACGGLPTPMTSREGEICKAPDKPEPDDGCSLQSLEWDDCRTPALRRFNRDPVLEFFAAIDLPSSTEEDDVWAEVCEGLAVELDLLDTVGRLTPLEQGRLHSEDDDCLRRNVAHYFGNGFQEWEEPLYGWPSYHPFPAAEELAADLAIFAWADDLRQDGLWDVPATIEFYRRFAAVQHPPRCETPFPACPSVPLTPELERLLLPVCLDLPAPWGHPPRIYDQP